MVTEQTYFSSTFFDIEPGLAHLDTLFVDVKLIVTENIIDDTRSIFD